ncbi:Gfo/Idh/MocA family protein [Cellulomonas soli]|uniref:Gfo/Idh/MocA family protein n=1 Tax=Cellulomonas soli TaxID=931535 RepID=UPI003F83C3CE
MTLPSSFPDPSFLGRGTAPSLRWGVVGAGHIAQEWVPAVQRHTEQRVVAVAARTAGRAEQFAARFGIETAVESAQQLLDLPQVDAVYVATPDSEHVPIGLMAVAAGKHVLVEKPVAPSAAQAQELFTAAARAGVLAMEAMWTRYLPQFDVIRRLVADGVLGELELVVASACRALVPARVADDGAFDASAVAGMGVYPIALASDLLGTPTVVRALGRTTPAGGDLTASVLLGHAGGAQASITTSIATRAPVTATISGTRARVDLEEFFFNPTSFTLTTPEKIGTSMRWQEPTGMALYDGLAWQVLALAQFAGEGRVESPLHTHAETVAILRTIESARAQLTPPAPR